MSHRALVICIAVAFALIAISSFMSWNEISAAGQRMTLGVLIAITGVAMYAAEEYRMAGASNGKHSLEQWIGLLMVPIGAFMALQAMFAFQP